MRQDALKMTDKSDKFDPSRPTLAFDYLKAPNFQSLRADGVIGGITPTGRIHMAVYSERPSIPRRLTYVVLDNGQLGDIVNVESRNSVVREMSADIFLDLRAAKAIRDWLSQQIDDLEKQGESK